MKYSELERKIRKETNCKVFREGGKHTIWINPDTGKQFPISRDKTKDVPPGTLKSIMRDAGLK